MRVFLLFCMLFFCTLPVSAADFGISPDDFRTQYNIAAKKLKAPVMPGDISGTLAVPEKDNSANIVSTVSIYSLNERVSLLLNCMTDMPDLVSGASIMAGADDEYTISSVSDIQTAMIAMITVLTPKMQDQERQKLIKTLGLVPDEHGDCTDGQVRSEIVDSFLFYTAASENTGIELVIKPAKKAEKQENPA